MRKSVPKNMPLKCLIPKSKKQTSRPKLYEESSDDNLNAVQDKEHKGLAKELSISSDDDDNTTGNTERDTSNKKDLGDIVDSQTSENGSKKSRSSRKDKKKSKKREKETLDQKIDSSNKSKKKKRKEKEKKGRKRHKSVEDTKVNSNSVANEKSKHMIPSIPLITEGCPSLTAPSPKILKHPGTKTNVFTR